jgi:hypothetical protein
MMHGIDKSCRLAAQGKERGLIQSSCSDRVPLEMPNRDMT